MLISAKLNFLHDDTLWGKTFLPYSHAPPSQIKLHL